jgi:hypothetical protein
MVHLIDPTERRESTSQSTPASDTDAETEPSPVSVPSRQAKPIVDVRDAYYPSSLEDFDQGFWWRPSTELYIRALARHAQVTPISIYAGADGPSDVGPPLHKDILTSVLVSLIRNDLLFGNIPPEARQEETAKRIVRGVAEACGTPYLGSVVRELCRTLTQHGYTAEGSQDVLRAAIQEAIAAPRTTSGQVAHSIALLAFVLRHAGVTTRVLNAYHDHDLTNVESEVRGENPSLRPYRFHAYDKLTWPAVPGPAEIPLIPMMARPHVRPSGSVVIGEVESIEDETPGPPNTTARSVLAQALEKTTVLFVGTSLTDPGVIATLARTRHLDVPRYAIMLPPELALADKAQWSLARALLAQRYLHLGVVPILADFPQQVPQFLREVAFKVHGRTARAPYEAYRRRLRRWWDYFGPLFGLIPDCPPADPEGLEYRATWGPILETMRETVGIALKEASPRWGIGGPADAITIELWIRNPKGRCLFKWATSALRDGAENDRPVVQLLDDDATNDVSRAFRDGIATKPAAIQDGECSVSVPLVLHKAPWHHLPVGVVRLRSDRATGALQYCASHASEMRLIEAHVQSGIEPMLDPLLRIPEDESFDSNRA